MYSENIYSLKNYCLEIYTYVHWEFESESEKMTRVSVHFLNVPNFRISVVATVGLKLRRRITEGASGRKKGTGEEKERAYRLPPNERFHRYGITAYTTIRNRNTTHWHRKGQFQSRA